MSATRVLSPTATPTSSGIWSGIVSADEVEVRVELARELRCNETASFILRHEHELPTHSATATNIAPHLVPIHVAVVPAFPPPAPTPIGSPPQRWLARFRDAVRLRQRPWHSPLVCTAGPETSFEWWSGARKLTVYVTRQDTHLIRVWGPRIQDDMADIWNPTVPEQLAAWDWLIGPN